MDGRNSSDEGAAACLAFGFRVQRRLGRSIVKNTILAVLLLGTVSWAQGLPYEPALVELTGTLLRADFDAQVDFDGDPETSATETVWILRLEAPAAFDENLTEYNQEVAEAEELQLVFHDEKLRQRAAGFLGQTVRIKASAFHAFGPHHFREVLLEVLGFTAASP